MTDSLKQLRDWVGRKELRHDVVAAWPLRALAATLGGSRLSFESGKPVPAGWHWIFFLDSRKENR